MLDGATGTELNRRGVDTGLPMWSANALTTDAGLNTLRQIHLDYLNAGASIITTNTFRTHRRALVGKGYDARELTKRAVQTAREAVEQFDPTPASRRFHSGTSPSPTDASTGSAHRWRGETKAVYVAGSIAPLEDCYLPNLVPPDDECRAEHSERIHHLVEAGADILLIETMNTIREAVIAAKLATITGLPVIVSFVCDVQGCILSGESLTVAADILLPLGVAALGVNCGPAHTLAKPLAELRAVVGPEFPLIGYGNIGYADEEQGWVNTDAVEPGAYAEYAQRWPVQIVGGCCGTTPEHIRKLRHFHED